jgi:adenine-specific DNA-methyltransferase
MMLPRLFLARNLLRDDGVIFVSIDDNEVHNLRLLMDEIFGEENFVAIFPWRKRTAKSDVPFGISQDYEWIICNSKGDNFFAAIEDNKRKYYETPDFPNRPWRIHEMTTHRTASERPNSFFTLINPKKKAKTIQQILILFGELQKNHLKNFISNIE